MFCCPTRVKCLVAGEVGKRDSSDREYYFDCEEPSSDEESCVHASESRTLKGTRSYLLPFLALILHCLATLAHMMGRTSGNTTEEIAAAAAAQTSATGEAAPEPPNVTDDDMGVAAPEISGFHEQAPFHYSEQTVGDTECTIFSDAGHLGGTTKIMAAKSMDDTKETFWPICGNVIVLADSKVKCWSG